MISVSAVVDPITDYAAKAVKAEADASAKRDKVMNPPSPLRRKNTRHRTKKDMDHTTGRSKDRLRRRAMSFVSFGKET